MTASSLGLPKHVSYTHEDRRSWCHRSHRAPSRGGTAAPRRGHDLAVLVRSPAKLGHLAERVTVIEGSSTDAVERLVAGAHAVVSALGPAGKQSRLHRETAAVLIPAMQRHGIRRYVGVSGAGIDVPGDHKGAPDRLISALVRRFGGEMAKDKVDEYGQFAASDLDWTLVRPPRLRDGEPTGAIRHDATRPGKTWIRRADLAAFLADVVEQGSYVRQAPFVSTA
ncbi:MAG: NAD(P)-dependent oxidoreductase [Dermatophilaceae bacterium]